MEDHMSREISVNESNRDIYQAGKYCNKKKDTSTVELFKSIFFTNCKFVYEKFTLLTQAYRIESG